MRLHCVGLFVGIVASTGASASSFVALPLHQEAASPSFVYLGAKPEVDVAAKPADAPAIEVALHYPAPLSLSLAAHAGTPTEAVKGQAGLDEKAMLALHYPPPLPGGLKAPVAQTRVSASVISMGEPAVEYFKVAAVEAEKHARPLFANMPLVMRGGIQGDAFAGGETASTVAAPQETARASRARSRKPQPEPAVDETAEPPAPPNGIAPLKSVQ